MSTNGALPLDEVRARAAAALAPISDDDPPVLVDVVDAIDPPVLMLLWGEPWLEPATVGRGYWTALFEVLCVASRIEPGPGIEVLETLVVHTVDRLRADEYAWPVATTSAPRRIPISGITYLAARVNYQVSVTIGGS